MAAIERRSFPKHESLASALEREVAHRAQTLLVARSGAGAVIGYLLYRRATLVVHVLKLCVAEQHRRRGVGTALLRAAIAAAAERPVQLLTLNVDPERTGAVALYTSLGFRQVSRRKDYYKVGRDALAMELELPGRGAASGNMGNSAAVSGQRRSSQAFAPTRDSSPPLRHVSNVK